MPKGLGEDEEIKEAGRKPRGNSQANEHPVPCVCLDAQYPVSNLTTTSSPVAESSPTSTSTTASLSPSVSAAVPSFLNGQCPPLTSTHLGPSLRIARPMTSRSSTLLTPAPTTPASSV